MDKSALHKLSYGIYVLTTKVDETPYGCIINTAFQITAQPPRMAISCNRDNYTHDKIAESGVFAVSALAEDSDASIIRTFGYNSGRDIDKFAHLPATDGSKLGLPLFPVESVATFECRVINQIEVGTHTLFIGEIEDCASHRPDAKEMTYRYYHEIRKGSAPKNAPTFIAEATPVVSTEPTAQSVTDRNEQPNERWQCSVCGYIYDKDLPFSELGDGWVCPVCGAAKSAFNKIG